MRLLENIVKLGVDGFLRLIEEDVVHADAIDHFLCHYSSHYFRGKNYELLTAGGAMIPEEKWYTNLYERGNTGCASLFIMIDILKDSKMSNPATEYFATCPKVAVLTPFTFILRAVEA